MHLRSASLLLLLTGSSIASGAVLTSPSKNTTAPGDAQGPAPLRFFGAGGARNQLLFPSSDFSPSGPGELISSVSFRPYPGSATSGFIGGTVSVSDVTIRLSNTQRTESGANMLSATYADNIGANAQTVYSGALTLTTTATDAPGSNGAYKVADYTINFQTPFLYTPALGNLLLDFNIPATATVSGTGFGFVTFDDANDAGDGVASVVNVNDGAATTGTVATDASIAQFNFTSVPEPTSLALLAGGSLLALRRSRRN